MHQNRVLILTLLAVTSIMVPLYASAQSENMVATVETKSGNFVIEFFPDVAPSHVNNFITLSKDGYYDGTVFHRVINGFMIQGGDPNTKDPELISLWGTGGPGYSVNAEFNDISHERGIVSMARSQDPNSAGSQFFIIHGDASFLDGYYTVFGKIVGDESFTTLDKIANMETSLNDVPVDWQNTEIISITFDKTIFDKTIFDETIFDETIFDETMFDETIFDETMPDETIFDETMPDETIFDETMPDETMPGGGGCLIATAAFGSEMAPQVQNLREIRDNIVLETESGRTFMTSFNHIYYAFSPTVADLERENPIVRDIIQITITPMIVSLTMLENIEINSEATMISYGMLVILVNIFMYVGIPLTVLYILKQYFTSISKNKKYIAA